MRLRHFTATLLLVAFLLPAWSNAQFYYGTHQTFGKNRVEYVEFNWTFMRFEQYDVFFYKGGRPIAEKASVLVRKNLRDLQRALDQTLDQRIRVMVFNSLTDLKQSNLNPNDEEEYNTGGVTRTAGTRMFVYFDGDYAHLEQQIREGLSYLLLSNMLYGGFTSAIKNSTLLNLPVWFTEGLTSYLSRPWNPVLDARVMDGFTAGTYKHLNGLTGLEATYCGHSIWNYIGYTYGDGVIKNILFLTIINRSVDRAISQVLGTSFTDFMEGWRTFYAKKYANGTAQEYLSGHVAVKAKPFQVLLNPTYSNNGQHLAYALNDQGLFKIFVKSAGKNKKKRVLKRGFRLTQNNDLSYPILAWHPNNRILAGITEEKGFIWLYFFDVVKNKKERKALFGFQKVLSASYSQDGKKLLLSAVKNGRSDIFVYTILSASITQITNDDFTDLYPAYINGDKQIVFSSNRTDDSLRDNQKVWRFSPNLDLFVYRNSGKDNKILWRLTNTPTESEVLPNEFKPGFISFLSNTEGQQSRHLIGIDSSIAYVDTTTHYRYSFTRYAPASTSHNILAESVSAGGEKISSVYFKNKRYYIYTADFEELEDFGVYAFSPQKNNTTTPQIAQRQPQSDPRIARAKKHEIDINDYQFDPSLVGESEHTKPTVLVETTAPSISAEKPEEEYVFPPARNYFTTLLRDNFTSKVDFIFDNPQYQVYTGVPNAGLLNAGFNMQFKLGAVDLFNDYRLVGGFRTDFQPIPGLSLSPNSEVLLGLVSQKKRLNKHLTLSRRSQFTPTGGRNLRILTYEGRMKWVWPLSEAQHISGTVGWRNQNTITLSDGSFGSVEAENLRVDYGVLKAAFVHDNTRNLGLNLYKGTRYKVFTEYYRNFSTGNSAMHTLGFDYRQYIPLHRNFIFAGRFAAGTSFGQEKLLHFLGGVDNALNPKTNNETPIAETENYTFQTVITNMRGFRQNIRNGNSFAVANAELRMPLFSYLLNKPIRSDFLNNFQIIGFTDVGTAWNGPTPWSEENALNSKVITTGNLTIIVDRQTNPLVAGYGLGLRSRILGYFVRADWAWGIQDGIILNPIFYLSLSTDF